MKIYNGLLIVASCRLFLQASRVKIPSTLFLALLLLILNFLVKVSKAIIDGKIELVGFAFHLIEIEVHSLLIPCFLAGIL